METLRYPYHLKWWDLLWFNALLVVMAALLWRGVFTNTEAGNIGGVIELSPVQLDIAFGIVAALITAAAIFSLRIAFHDMTNPGELIVTADTITAQPMPWRPPMTIRFADVTHVAITRNRRERFLEIKHPSGKLTIMPARLPDKTAFQRVCQLVGEGTTARQKAAPSRPGITLPPDP